MRSSTATIAIALTAAVAGFSPPAVAGPPQIVLEVSDATVYEGDAGSVLAQFQVRRIGSHTNKAITVGWSSFDGTAAAGSDFVASAGSLVFDNQHTLYTVSVPVSGDATQEPDEYFFVRVDQSGGGDGEGRGTILNDDGWPPDTGTG